jgi:hypothetical protein
MTAGGPRASGWSPPLAYGAEAIQLLARARDLGYFNTTQAMRSMDDPDFATLWPRPDLAALRGDILFPADPFSR